MFKKGWFWLIVSLTLIVGVPVLAHYGTPPSGYTKYDKMHCPEGHSCRANLIVYHTERVTGTWRIEAVAGYSVIKANGVTTPTLSYIEGSNCDTLETWVEDGWIVPECDDYASAWWWDTGIAISDDVTVEIRIWDGNSHMEQGILSHKGIIYTQYLPVIKR